MAWAASIHLIFGLLVLTIITISIKARIGARGDSHHMIADSCLEGVQTWRFCCPYKGDFPCSVQNLLQPVYAKTRIGNI